MVPMIGMNQIAIRTIGQVFIAKDEINFLARKHFLSLGSRRAGDHIRGKAIERANENLANFQLRRSDQNANLTLRWITLWCAVKCPSRLGVCKRGRGE